MESFVDILSIALKIFVLYTTIVSLFCLLPRRKFHAAAPKTRFAVLLAARNEEAVIGASVGALLRSNYPKELFDVFVIPNNCTDDTEGAARRAGAKIISCTAPVHNKGDALHQAFAALSPLNYDAYCVFDADNLADPDFLARMNDAFCAGYRVAKGKLQASNPGQSWIAGCYDLYFENFDLFYSRPRASIGLSAKLVGTGFAVSRSFLEELGGWNTTTIAEDAEFAALCAEQGERIAWVPEAISYDEEPLSFRQSLTQRRRWCSGVQEVGFKMIPRLWHGFLRGGNLRALDFAVFLSMPFVQILAVIPALWNFASALGSPGWALQLLLSAAGFWIGATAMAFGLALLGRRPLRSVWTSVLLYPIFTASWLPLHIIGLFRKTAVWKPMAHGNAPQYPAIPTRERPYR